MQKQLTRLTEMLNNEDPRTPNYEMIINNICRLNQAIGSAAFGTAQVPEIVGDDSPEEASDQPTDASPTAPKASRPSRAKKPVEAPAETAPAEEPTAEESDTEEASDVEAPVITLEEVRIAMSQASTVGKKDVRPLIEKYGCKNLSAVPAEYYADLLAALKELA